MKQNSIIYQIFPRNHSKERTFKKIEEDLARISSLGINIIYLMPIHEIGLKERKENMEVHMQLKIIIQYHLI